MARPPPQSFLLRLWREQADAPLRATLIPVAQPQTPRHFATLEALHAYLYAECAAGLDLDELNLTNCTASAER
jgi:hypothetical protein